jgi:hypothetical protein
MWSEPDGLDARLLSYRLLPRLGLGEEHPGGWPRRLGLPTPLTVKAELTAADGRRWIYTA